MNSKSATLQGTGSPLIVAEISVLTSGADRQAIIFFADKQDLVAKHVGRK